mgnify:CR=1 FL=1
MSNATTEPGVKYDRVMLKISGEALMGDQGYGLHPPTVARIAQEVKSVRDMGVEVCMVIGGGNIFRGLAGSAQGMERTTADYMGMLATVMNALAMQSALEQIGVYTRVISAIPMDQVCEPYIRRRAVRHLEKKRVCIFAAGTGNPYFTTDTAATLRANDSQGQQPIALPIIDYRQRFADPVLGGRIGRGSRLGCGHDHTRSGAPCTLWLRKEEAQSIR